MNNFKPEKVSEEFFEFIKKIGVNRTLLGKKELYKYKRCDLIVKYFKSHPKEYEEMIKGGND